MRRITSLLEILANKGDLSHHTANSDKQFINEAMTTQENIILNKTIDFALDIIDFTELLEEKRKYVIANQLLKSGTSIGAKIEESVGGSSRKDFVYKLETAYKEAREEGIGQGC